MAGNPPPALSNRIDLNELSFRECIRALKAEGLSARDEAGASLHPDPGLITLFAHIVRERGREEGDDDDIHGIRVAGRHPGRAPGVEARRAGRPAGAVYKGSCWRMSLAVRETLRGAAAALALESLEPHDETTDLGWADLVLAAEGGSKHETPFSAVPPGG